VLDVRRCLNHLVRKYKFVQSDPADLARARSPRPASSSTPTASTSIFWPPGKGLPKDEAGNFIANQEKSDVVHDLLAHLAEKMLEMNKQTQTEIKGFLGWLESYLGAKVEDLTRSNRK
jgi:hypothetical protein